MVDTKRLFTVHLWLVTQFGQPFPKIADPFPAAAIFAFHNFIFLPFFFLFFFPFEDVLCDIVGWDMADISHKCDITLSL